MVVICMVIAGGAATAVSSQHKSPSKQIPVQSGPGDSVRYMRRGWDFTMQNVIKWFHEDKDFCEAAQAAHPLDFNDPNGLVGNMYMHELDRQCNHCLSERSRASDAGIYGIGAGAFACVSDVVRLWFEAKLNCDSHGNVIWSFVSQAPMVGAFSNIVQRLQPLLASGDMTSMLQRVQSPWHGRSGSSYPGLPSWFISRTSCDPASHSS